MRTARTRRIAVAALALVAMIPAGQGLAPAHPARVALSTAGTWDVGALDANGRSNFVADAADAIPAARPVLDLIDGSISVDADTTSCPTDANCSYPTSDLSQPWRIHLRQSVLADTSISSRFLALHEMGHAVWDLVFTAADQQAFAAAVRQSLHGHQCRKIRSDAPCAPINEMFADEFARWAGRFAHSSSGYETPALLDAATFGALVRGATSRLQTL
jgi:hypothetical protein